MKVSIFQINDPPTTSGVDIYAPYPHKQTNKHKSKQNTHARPHPTTMFSGFPVLITHSLFYPFIITSPTSHPTTFTFSCLHSLLFGSLLSQKNKERLAEPLDSKKAELPLHDWFYSNSKLVLKEHDSEKQKIWVMTFSFQRFLYKWGPCFCTGTNYI